jgi:PAS domain S-box-containing protein
LDHNPARRLFRGSWSAVACIAALLVLHQLLLQPWIARLSSDAPVINVSGRQRMLSQRLSKAALALEYAPTQIERAQRREELIATVEEWTRAQRGLQRGDPELHLPGATTPAAQQAFRDVDPHFQAIVAAAQALLAIDPARTDAAAHSARALAVQTILRHEAEFLTRMHALVGLFETEARQRIQSMQAVGLAIMAAILGLLLLVQWLVVQPAVKLVGREFEQSEEQYRRLVESMNDGVLVYDLQGRVQFANRRFGEIVGVAVSDLIGKPVSVFVADADRRRFDTLPEIASALAGPVEIALWHHAGRTVETMVSPRPLTHLDGSPQGVLLVLTDMTAHKQAEARGRELLDQLAHADRLKSMGEMAAELAHEINQPLGAISNYAEACLVQLTAPQPGPTDFTAPLQRILKAALRGGEIIRRARSFSQMRPHTVAEVSINDLVCEVDELCRPEARRRAVFVTLQLADELPSIAVDGIQIQQVLTNLIQNAFHALEATPEYRRRLTIRTGRLPNDEIEVAVSDNGPGFSAADAERLFEPFVTTRAEGTGMGLAIARSIVAAHGGRIEAERLPEGGALFRFTLPLEPPTISGSTVVTAAPVREEWAHD